jgi:ribosome recycling factor
VANIAVQEGNVLIIQPWDKSILRNIEQAIAKSDLGLTPNNDGNLIRLVIPPLTEERRLELAKVVGRKAEEGRIAIRNIRRDAREELRRLEKEEHISEDEVRRAEKELDKLTEKYIADVDEMKERKETEIVEPHA